MIPAFDRHHIAARHEDKIAAAMRAYFGKGAGKTPETEQRGRGVTREQRVADLTDLIRRHPYRPRDFYADKMGVDPSTISDYMQTIRTSSILCQRKNRSFGGKAVYWLKKEGK